MQQLLVRGVKQEVEELLRVLLLPRGRSSRRCRSRRRLACSGIHNPIKTVMWDSFDVLLEKPLTFGPVVKGARPRK